MNGMLSIVISSLILTLFIAVIDITKKIFQNFYYKNKRLSNKKSINWQDYQIGEFKVVFVTTFIFTFILIFTLLTLGKSIIGFDLYSHMFKRYYNLEDICFMLGGTIFIFALNSILYTGYIIQLVKRYEILSLEDKEWILIVKENIYGPLLEEIIYRGVIFNILKEASFTNVQTSLISSFMFGICKNKTIITHLRHIFDHDYNTHDLPRIIGQALFTSVFGLYACYAYIKANTLLAPIVLHIACNTLQFPRFNYRRDTELPLKEVKMINRAYIIGIVSFFIIIFFF